MDPVRAQAGELTADEIIDALREGRRVVIQTEMFGSSYDLTLRHDGTTYYCDTPTRLHKHDEEAEMRKCIERMGYGRETEVGADGGSDGENGDDGTTDSDDGVTGGDDGTTDSDDGVTGGDDGH